MLRVIQLNNGDFGTDVSWSKFVDKINYLIPKTMNEKMILFIKAIAPQDLPESEFDNY